MRIIEFFRRQPEAYVSIDTEGAWRRDARPFVSFDTNVPYVAPLSDNGPRFEIFERDINREPVEVAEEVELTWEFEMPEMLLLQAPKAQKLLQAGKSPLLLMAPEVVEKDIEEVLEAQHVVYFSDIEFRDGAEIVTEAKIKRENKRNFIGAKFAALFLMIMGVASILFPPASLNASKLELNVNPTNTTPGLSFAISNNDMTISTDPITSEQTGNLGIAVRSGALVTSTLDLDVSTTGADGYKLYVTTSGTDKKNDYTNALVNKDINTANGEGAKINALTGDTTMSAFPAGYWGYTTESSLQNNTLFKAFPTYDSTDAVKHGGTEIASANTAIADNDSAGETPLTIGVKADNTLPAGDYRNDLLFTVIANPVTVTYNLMFDANATDSSLAGMPATVTASSADVFRNLTIPNAEPTRDDFIFAGWAESANTPVVYAPGDEVTLQVVNINDSQTVNKTLYAVWEQKEYLQDFDTEAELLNTGDTKTLYDKRDGETYTVKRLPDGNVWMTQNLRYETGAIAVSSNTEYGAYYNWSTALTICPSGWHLPSSSEQVTLDIAYGFSGESRTGAPADIAKYMRTDGDWPGFTTAGYYNDTNNEIRNAGTHYAYWSRTPDANTGREAYAWYTTGNLDDFYPAYSNRKALGFSVRCVAGEEQKKYMQDFNDAIDLRTVGNSDTYYDKRDGTAYTVKRLPDGKVWMTQNLAYTTGAYRVSDNAGYGAYYTWSVAQNVCPAGWHLPSGGSSGEYATLDRAYGYSGSNRTDAQAIQNYQLTTGNWPGMVLSGQYLSGTDYTGDRVLHWTSTASDSSNAYSFHFNTGSSKPMYPVYAYPKTAAATVRCVGDQPNVFYIQDFDENTMLPNANDSAVLTDRRDGETYRVTRLADGNVWMTQNLRLTLTAGETLTVTNTDVPASGLHVDYNTITSGGVAWDASTVRSYNSGVRDYGVYYNWYAATAGTRSTEYSICPSGWRLPSSAEYGTLVSTYGFNQTTVRNAPFYMATSDHYDPKGTVYNRGTLGHLWTSTENTSTNGNAYFMFFNASSISNAATHSQAYGFAVRCVAREDAKVSFDANGGSGTMAVQTFTKGVRQAISTNTFTRTGYDFAGWALTPGATTAKYADGQSVVFNKVTTLYAVWKVNYMQDFDAKTALSNTGDTKTLVDSRDGSTYTVRRLEDGKVWMTQNLRYTGTTDPGTTTRYSGTFTANASDSQGSGTITLTNNFGSNASSSAFAAYRGDVADGAYYGWTAATMVCPKGWHLPTSDEYINLDVSYGGTGTNTTNAASYGNWVASNKANISLSGRYVSTDFNYDGTKGRYWSATTVTGDASKAYSPSYDYDLNNTVDPASPNGWKYYGFSVRCIADESETVSFDANGGSGTMADATVEKGGSVTLTNSFTRPAYNFAGWATSAGGTVVYTDGQTISVDEDITLYALWTPKGDFIQNFNQDTELAAIGSTKTLYDERDGKTYTVKRLADGKVWMTQNLAITNTVLTSDDTNLPSGTTFDMTSLAQSGSTGWCATDSQACDDVKAAYVNSDGGFYNWYTATAGYGTYATSANTTVNYDICPKGWHLPIGGDNNTSNEFALLDKALGGTGVNTVGASNYSTMAALFQPVGYINETFGYVNTSGTYWSATAQSGSKAYNLGINATNSTVGSRYNYYKYSGFSVRCIANYTEKTVSFNANGGSGTMASKTVVKGQSLTLPTNTMTRTGYKFIGWSTTNNASTAMYTDGQTITVNSDVTLYAVWETLVAFTSNGLSWTKVMGQANFYNASSLCPAGFRIPTRAQLRTLIGASSDGVWVSNSTVTSLYNTWQSTMIWSSDAYGSGGAYDLYFQNGQAIITATSNASSNATVVCVK